MSFVFRFSGAVAALAAGALLFCATVQAQSRPVPATTAGGLQRVAAPAVSNAPLSPRARGEFTRRFVQKWGHYVQRVYEVPVGVWSKRMIPNFVAADSANFRAALARDTFEGAMAELSGTGTRVSDARVIERMARAQMTSADKPRIVARDLGSLSSDLTYTPLQPCRIVDTRNTAAGPIAANSTRSFTAINLADFTAQGGSATNCGTLGLNASAIAINVTAVTPSSAGFATVYPFGTTQPNTASVNYTAGSVVNNAIISQVPNPLASSDFTVYTFGQAHFVVDIVGYFSAPTATALECTQTFTTAQIAAFAAFDQVIPSCPTGYSLVGAGCRTPGFDDANWAVNGLYQISPTTIGGFCSGRNKTDGPITVEGVGRCCRTPGR
jgi:hypothetical protein